jgi:oligopeptide/dipeptide ABC transporter ATP-binding protein
MLPDAGAGPRGTDETVLAVDDLRVDFETFDGLAQVLNGVSMRVGQGQRVGLVGESGCGKSVTMRAIMGILAAPPARIAGRIVFEGRDLLTMARRPRTALKGSAMSMVFQDPMTSLNPVFRIGEQLTDIVRWADRRHGLRRGAPERKARILETLRQVRLPDPERIFEAYPIQLSGGMRQRVLIAMALLNRPRFLIADEPGTALDVTTQDEILRLLNDLVQQERLALLMITHNLGVVRETTDYTYVMYAGSIVEEGTTAEVFAAPAHPYTRALFACVPKLSGDRAYRGIEGTLPDYTDPPLGCRFHTRCQHATERCLERPPAFARGGDHRCSCWLSDPAGGQA